MTEYLDFIKTKHLEKAIDDNACNFQNEFPKLMKLLIRTTCGDNAFSRIPDDVEVGFDGVVNNSTKNSFVAKGLSVWEFGTDEGVKKKINEDYSKRTNNPRGVDKSNAVLYLCTPRKWPARSESIEKWKKAHSGDWKNVEILDAQIITDWLNKTPSVCAWFLEQFTKEKNINISTLDFAWEELVSRTNPVLKESFFDFGEEANSEIQNRIGKNKAITICANNKIDSYGFILRFLKLAGKEKVLVVYDKNILEKIQNVASGQIILCNFDIHEIMAKNGNCVIACCSMENKSGDSIVLPERDYARTNNALVDSGVDASYASSICQTTHLKTCAIMRKIKSEAYSESYGWRRNASEDNLLKALLCVQKCMSTAQKEAIKDIAGLEKVEEVENRLEQLAVMNDSPIIKDSKGNFALAVPEEVADVFIDGNGKEVFINRAHKILKEILDNGMRWKGYDRGECGELLDSLTTFYVYVSEYANDKNLLNMKVEEILNCPIIFDEMIQGRVIPHFCEATPELLLKYFENNIDKIINEVISKDVFIKSIELLLDSGCVEGACSLAIKVYLATKEEEILEILSMALCPFRNYPEFDIEKKKELAVGLVKLSGENMPLVFDWLLKCDYYFSADRVITKKANERGSSVTWDQCFNYYEGVADACVEFGKKLCFEISKIILKNLNRFRLDYLSEAIRRFDYDVLGYKEIAEIQLELIRQRGFYKSEGNVEYVKMLDAWLELIAHNDSTLENLWLFNSYYHYVNYHFDDTMTLEEARIKTNKERRKYFHCLRDNKPDDYMQILSGIMKDDQSWGDFIFQNDKEKIKSWVSVLIEQKKALVLAGLLDCLERGDMEPLLKILSDETRLLVVGYMKNSVVCDLITEPEKKLFWENKEMINFSEESYRNLLRYNPGGLISYLYSNNNVDREHVIEILKAINGSLNCDDEKERHGYDEYIQILSRYPDDLDDELDAQVFELFINGRVYDSILQSNRFTFRHLDRIKDVVVRRDRFYSYNLYGLRIPSEFCTNTDKLETIWNYIKGMEHGYDVFASIIINTIYLEADNNIRRKFLEYIESCAEQDLLDDVRLKLDISITNGFLYNGFGRNIDMKKLLGDCSGLPKIQKTIKEAVKNNVSWAEYHEKKWNDDKLAHDHMRIIK